MTTGLSMMIFLEVFILLSLLVSCALAELIEFLLPDDEFEVYGTYKIKIGCNCKLKLLIISQFSLYS